MNAKPRTIIPLISLLLMAAAGGCSDDDIDSDEEARRAYLGLDQSIEKSLNLGFDGFNSASSANISPQMTTGDDTGTLTITGQVDQGSSDNKGMRLYVDMVDYSDGEFTVEVDGDEVTVDLTYDTSEVEAEQPYLQLSLRNIPNGTFTGSLTGTYLISGDIDGEADLNLSFAGNIQDAGGGVVTRVPGTTTITGTATSGEGVYDVDLTI